MKEDEEDIDEGLEEAPKKKKSIWLRIAKNKYLFVIGFFLAWMIFFDNNNWFYLKKLTEEAQTKRKEKAYYQNEIEESERKLRELTTDLKALEKFGREQYFMKKSNEDVFVFFPESK